jgi:hypothetical protein
MGSEAISQPWSGRFKAEDMKYASGGQFDA